jgi:hypothetical protein
MKETKLFRGYVFYQVSFKREAMKLSYNFIYIVAEGDGPEVIKGRRII